jgi:hypothetical protein
LQIWDWKSYFNGRCCEYRGIAKAHVFAFTFNSSSSKAEVSMKTWHCTSDWGDPTNVLLSNIDSEPPNWILPQSLDKEILDDVLSICDINHRLQPDIKQSYFTLFNNHKKKVFKIASSAPMLDLDWIKSLGHLNAVSEPNPVLLELAMSQEERHNVTATTKSKNHITFATGLIYFLS